MVKNRCCSTGYFTHCQFINNSYGVGASPIETLLINEMKRILFKQFMFLVFLLTRTKMELTNDRGIHLLVRKLRGHYFCFWGGMHSELLNMYESAQTMVKN